jgi:glycosyltransferase involved in cell wall biosynthesis
MKVLFVGSGNHGEISPIIKSQGDSLLSSGVEVEYFLIKGKGVRGYLRHVKSLRKFLGESGFDVIHAHYSLSAFTASLAGAKPMVVSLMGSDVKATWLYKMVIRLFARVFRWKEIVVKSRDMYEDLRIRRAKIIPNGVDLELFKSLDQGNCRRSLDWDTEGIHVLFPADPSREEKDFELAVAATNLLDSSVKMHVFEQVDHKMTPLHFNAADVVLLTSKWEGSPNVIKEALACGSPIVSTDVGDVKERMAGVEGCYVANTREPRELKDLLQKAVSFKGRTNGRDKIIVDGLDNRHVAKQLIEIYERVLRSENH